MIILSKSVWSKITRRFVNCKNEVSANSFNAARILATL